MTHGPLTGAVTSNSAQVWLRTSQAAQVRIEFSPINNTQHKQTSRAFNTRAENDFTVSVPLENLEPNTQYSAQVWVNERAQGQGARFKTFPLESTAAPFKMVILTDLGYAVPSIKLKTFEKADAENPDLVFIGGDFDHRDPKLLPDKRKMFQDLYADDPASPVYPFTQFILHRYPLAHQWDDHDYGGDNSDRTAVWRETALQVYQEYFPSYPLGKYGIYQSFRYGSEVEIFVLDNRSQRDPNKAPDTIDKSMLNGEHHSDGQWQWLLDGLKNSTARWKLIMTASPMNNTLAKGDSWANFSHERDALQQFIHDNKIGGVIILGGDLHGGALDDGRNNSDIPTAVVPSANLSSCFTVPNPKLGKWSHGTYGSALPAKNNVPCAGYGVVTLNGENAHIEIKDGDGKVRLEMQLANVVP